VGTPCLSLEGADVLVGKIQCMLQIVSTYIFNVCIPFLSKQGFFFILLFLKKEKWIFSK
jgi:hypothetical protein